ncbi:Piso0_003937 [Millerozyma farinosa CBS 7064]|uniref:Piso0_003937 protein n=1 Tax=Pichia sorbitophila (strain ATCC MYA-4447 / BCRC 22081 / CBS 7064 / NBRC 10061 / NRRL Y-12695) TaxID=559304 RepID=G8Y9X9_PICSO|nr:Piso0_003937 [Millerozyma farinosa CBS 7064]CCE84393.1 Piso0_003937 [Millerozyma farinosa CBS 7064]
MEAKVESDRRTDQPSLRIPIFDLEDYTGSREFSNFEGKVALYDNRQLLIRKREVVVVKGLNILKKLKYEDDIKAAFYTIFNSNSSSGYSGTEALVVCLKKSAHVVYENGISYEVNFPFSLKKAFPFDSGVVLEKDQSGTSFVGAETYPQPLHAARFLTLVDPIGEFRIITSSSTSAISPHETMMSFPGKHSNKVPSICVTFNAHERCTILYHIRSSSRAPKKSGPEFQRPQKRKPSMISTPNPNRILEDESMHLDPKYSTFTSLSGNSHRNALSLNMEKKRTSTLLSDVSSIARMGSDTGFPDSVKTKSSGSSTDYSVFRKDMILTRIDVFQQKVDWSNIDISQICYEDYEAVVVINKKLGEANAYIYKQQSNQTPKYESCYTIKCLHCIPFHHSKHDGFLVVLKDEKTMYLVNPFLAIHSFPINLESHYPVSELMSSSENDISILSPVGESRMISLAIDPSNDLVEKCLQCFKYLSGSKVSESVRLLWCCALTLDENKDDWNAFIIVLLSLIFPFNEEPMTTQVNNITKLLPKAKYLQKQANLDYHFVDLIPYIVISLHLLREDLKLDVLSKAKVEQMGELLSQLTVWMGWPEVWSKYYMVSLNQIDRTTRFLSVYIIENPPDLFASLTSLFTNTIIPYLTFSQLVEEGDIIDMMITPRTYFILKLFEVIVSPNFGPSDVIDMMCQYKITANELDTYPIAIALPLKEAISLCQESPVFEWTSEALELAGRKDLSMFLNYERVSQISNNSSKLDITSSSMVRDVNHILSNVLDKNESVMAWDDQSEADRINVTKLIFDYDRRYYEITTLLHQTKTQTATLIMDSEISEYDMFTKQRELAALVALRTLTIPMGRAALFYAGRIPLLTEKFPIAKFNFSTLISPMMTNIILAKGAISDYVCEWGYFHNGVSAGLTISRESKGISGSWIIFNKPPELNSQHAGFLLGLGLNGHLKKLEEWHIYNYLGPKHPLTSVGLLIGMAASLRGSMDNKLTKVLSVHAVALLPQGANDLNVSVIVQTAGLIGIGLLYLESQHRRMSEVLLSQITGSVSQNDVEQIHEGYRLAAGIALGFVNLGKGNDLRGLNDTHFTDTLLSLAISMRDAQPSDELDKSCCGAIIALGFIFMKTRHVAIATKLQVPATEQLLDYVRPDHLLLRCVARNLIMWDDIGTSIEWVNSEIPVILREKYSLESFDMYDSDQLPYLNILGGLCLSIAFRYASSHNRSARDTLLYYLDLFIKTLKRPARNYDQKISRRSMNDIQDLVALSAAVVMAGSGDLDTFRRLRVLQGDTSNNMRYGNYMAINTALGFLFLGGGQYAIGNSNFAIACLVTSLYPVLPSGDSDYEIHLQALRHFWALSVENRCLVVRDVDTCKPCKIPITVKLRDGNTFDALSPCLLPNLEDVSMISTNSQNHFNVFMDFQLNSEYLEIFKKSLTIFVYKRRNYSLLKTTVASLLKNENKSLQIENGEVSVDKDVATLLRWDIFNGISDFEKQIFLYETSDNDDMYKDISSNGLSIFNIIDTKIDLELMANNPQTVDQLRNLKLLFAYTDRLLQNDLHVLSLNFVENLKHTVWSLATS